MGMYELLTSASQESCFWCIEPGGHALPRPQRRRRLGHLRCGLPPKGEKARRTGPSAELQTRKDRVP